MCRSDRKVRELNTSADMVAFIEHQASWRQAHKAGWFDDWGCCVPTKRERRERDRIAKRKGSI